MSSICFEAPKSQTSSISDFDLCNLRCDKGINCRFNCLVGGGAEQLVFKRNIKSVNALAGYRDFFNMYLEDGWKIIVSPTKLGKIMINKLSKKITIFSDRVTRDNTKFLLDILKEMEE